MLDTMVNPVCYKDRKGIYLGVNKIFTTQIAGIPEEEIVGYTLPEAVYRKFCKFELALYPFSSAQRTRMHSQWLIYSHS
jgi:hypothetical protein